MKQEAIQINQNFRRSIRRKKIDELFSKKRRELLTEHASSRTPNSNQQQYLQISRDIEENLNSLDLNILKAVAKLSANSEGLKLINKPQLHHLLIGYLGEEFLNTSEQFYATFALSNIFCINDLSQQPNSEFLDKLFTTAINGAQNTKQNCMAMIFHIIHDSDLVTLHTLTMASNLNIVNVFYQQMRSEPSSGVVRETFRCLYILMKKMSFSKLQNLGKMKKFILIVIRNAFSFQLTYMGAMCLSGLITCQPEERDLSKTGILRCLVQQSKDHQNLAKFSLNIMKMCIDSEPQSEVKSVILPFLIHIIRQSFGHSLTVAAYKLLYQIVVSSKKYIGFIFHSQPNLFPHILNTLNESIDKQLGNQICYCVCMLLRDVEVIPKSQVYEAQHKLSKVLSEGWIPKDTEALIENVLSCIQK